MRIGIIGAGNIAKRFATSLKNVNDAELYAISARNEEKREKFKKEFHVEKAYSTHLEVLEDEKVNAVYIGLPHHLHYTWVKEAILHHKAVLCEKPLCLHYEEAKEIFSLAKENHVLVMEALKPRFTNAYIAFKNALSSFKDDIEHIEISTGFVLQDGNRGYPTSEEAGGCLYDMGIYAISFLTDICKEDWIIDDVKAVKKQGVDFHEEITLHTSTMTSHMTVSFMETLGQIKVQTKEGEYTLSPTHRPLLCNGVEYHYTHDDFYGEIKHFCDLYNEGKIESKIANYEDSIRNIQLLEAIHSKL